ncbi:MAG: AMP-binding protein [Sphingobium sp.]|nr:AMP-binding protein [Sphingobium sp.]
MIVGGNQERYLLAERASDASFFIVVWFEARGALDLARLRDAIAATTARHPSLRTGFVLDPEQGFRPIVHDKASFGYHEGAIDAVSHEAVAQACAPFLRKVADISDPAGLQHHAALKVGADHWVLVFSHHHAVSDGESLDIFVSEVASTYSGAPLATSADADFKGPSEADLEQSRNYFRDALGGVETVSHMHRNLAGARRMDFAPATLDTALTAALQEQAARSSRFSIMASVFAAQVFAMTGSPDVVFSIQSSGRRRGTPAIGSFSNALPIRVQIDPEETFDALAARMRGLVRSAVEHEALPYHRIQQETGVKPDFALNLYPDAPDLAFDGLTIGPREFLPSDSDYGVNLRWQRRDGPDGLSYAGEAYFNAGEVDRARVEAFNRRHEALMRAALADPARRIADLIAVDRPSATEAVLAKALPARRIYALVQEAADAHPRRAAIVTPDREIDYETLRALVEEEASLLAALGVTQGQSVAFLAARDAAFVVTMLALSRLGAVFAVFDAEYPDSRLLELAESLSPDLIVACSEALEDRLPAFRDAGFRVAERALAGERAPAPLPTAPRHDELAYYLFTSGTTGKPRSVGVGHAALPAFLDWQRSALGIAAEDRVSLLSGLAHDPVMRDIFLPLTTGAALCIPDPDSIRDPRALTAWLKHRSVTVIHTTPPMGRLIVEISGGEPALPALRRLCWGGDILRQELVNQFSDANPQLRQYNFYGSTETPQAVASCDIGRDGRDRAVVPIGRAIDLTRLSVVNDMGAELAIGEVGQIMVDTPYFVRLADRNGAPPAGQRYATGDLGYRLPGGVIQLIGRADDQVKVRGYRVELADVEHHLRALDNVAQATVLPGQAPDGSTVLIAHVRLAEAAPADDASRSIIRAMGRALPSYMVPAQVILHDPFPLLPNGKIDRTALRRAQEEQSWEAEAADESEPASFRPMERAIADVFTKVTGRRVSSPDGNFADLGADSLNSIQAMLRLEAILSNLPDDWHDMSVRDLAALGSRDRSDGIRQRLLEQLRPMRVDPAVPIRAVSIALIVAFHFDLYAGGGGLTFLLFFLSGVAFARFQLGTVLKGTVAPIASGLIKVAIVSFPIGLMYGAKLYADHIPDWPKAIFFAANFIDYWKYPGALICVWLWYAGCFLQMYLFLMAVFASKAVRRVVAAEPFRYFLAAFLVLTAIRFALPALFNAGGLGHIRIMSIWTYLPTTHLPTFFLGVLVQLSRGNIRQMGFIVALGLLYCLEVSLYFPGRDFWILGGGVAFAALIPMLPLPHVVARLAGHISQGSLLIYLLHMPVRTALVKFGLPIGAPTLVGVIVGITLFAIQFDRVYAWARDQIVARFGRRNLFEEGKEQTL